MSQVHITKTARAQIKALMMEHVHSAADRIADACNEQSSWGFYTTVKDENGAAVFTLVHEAVVDNQRAQRILRNVDRGRV